jgi:hypothetical protein
MHVMNAPERSRAAHARRVAMGVEGIVGVGAAFGGWGLLSDADGLGAKQQWLDGSPFPDYTVPGLVLLVVIGGGMLAAAASTAMRARFEHGAAGLMATLLLAWGATESVTIGWRGWQQAVLVGAFVIAPALVLGSYWRQGRRAR